MQGSTKHEHKIKKFRWKIKTQKVEKGGGGRPVRLSTRRSFLVRNFTFCPANMVVTMDDIPYE